MGQAPSNLSVQDIRQIKWGKIAVTWQNYDTKETAQGIFDISRDYNFMNNAVHRDNGQYIARIDPIRVDDTNATLPYGSIWLFSSDGTNWEYIGDYGMQSHRILTIEAYTGTIPSPKPKKKYKPYSKPKPKYKPYSKPKYKPILCSGFAQKLSSAQKGGLKRKLVLPLCAKIRKSKSI